MKYILDRRFRLRGWQRAPYALFDTQKKEPEFLPRDLFLTLIQCDGAHDLNEGEMDEAAAESLQRMRKLRMVRPALPGEILSREQAYLQYPARYKRNIHWSITGACNLKCRHCFMSAPHAKHGNPSHEQLVYVMDQLADCGIFQVGLTGGEPLIRGDFFEILEELAAREIGVDVIYTNGWLIDEHLLDALDRIFPDMKVSFQLSFDGVGAHDFLRGVPGAEKRTLQALALLQERGHSVNISMCLHRKNMDTVRESVKLMASLGVRSMKVGDMMNLGEWTDPALRDLEITPEERMSFFESYIPQYFEDDAPLSIMLSGMFSYTPGAPEWDSFLVKPCEPEMRDKSLSCSSLTRNLYIGADGVVAPCMGMADCSFASRFPNLFDTPLREILGDSELMKFCNVTVSEVHNGNDECAVCPYKDRCSGGCRNTVLLEGDDYYGADHEACWFFRHNGEERIRNAAKNAFAAYMARHPEYKDTTKDQNHQPS